MTQLQDQKKETVNITCRVDRTLYEILVKECSQDGISLNSLINSITKRYLSWERYADKIGFVPITKRAVAQIFNTLDPAAIKKIAGDVGSSVPRELMALTFVDHDLYNIIQLIENWASKFGTVRADMYGSTLNITVHHGICKNFSEYLAEMHKAMAQNLSFKLTVGEIGENFLRMQIEP